MDDKNLDPAKSIKMQIPLPKRRVVNEPYIKEAAGIVKRYLENNTKLPKYYRSELGRLLNRWYYDNKGKPTEDTPQLIA